MGPRAGPHAGPGPRQTVATLWTSRHRFGRATAVILSVVLNPLGILGFSAPLTAVTAVAVAGRRPFPPLAEPRRPSRSPVALRGEARRDSAQPTKSSLLTFLSPPLRSLVPSTGGQVKWSAHLPPLPRARSSSPDQWPEVGRKAKESLGMFHLHGLGVVTHQVPIASDIEHKAPEP